MPFCHAEIGIVYSNNTARGWRLGGSCATARRRKVALGTALLLTPLFCGVAPARNVALLVGVGQLRDPQLKSQELLGTGPDIDAVQQALIEHWGFQARDVRAVRDEEATHERILAEISALEERSVRGDTVVIYFSGHGTSASAQNASFDLPYATGAWIPYDLDLSSLAAAQRTLIVGRRDLVPRLKRLDAGGRWVIVVSDSCYSGQVVRSLGRFQRRSRYLPLITRDLGVARVNAEPSARPQPPPYPYHHVLLLSGASDSETGADISSPEALQQSPTIDGKYHGAFTDAFLRLLGGQLLPGAFNYVQGNEAMGTFLEHHNFAQHPQLLPGIAEDPQNVGSNPFLNMNRPTPPSAATPVRDKVVRIRLETQDVALRAKVASIKGVAIVDEPADLTVRQRGGLAQLAGPAGDPIITTSARDPNLVKRIAGQVWFNRALPESDDTFGLRAETSPGSRGNTFVQCESFVFEVRLKQPAYIMLLDLDSQGNLTILYPTRSSERQIVAAGEPTAIPRADPIQVTAPFGSDQVAVLAFAKLPRFFSDLTDVEHFPTDGTRATALANNLNGAPGSVSVKQLIVHTYPGSKGAFCSS